MKRLKKYLFLIYIVQLYSCELNYLDIKNNKRTAVPTSAQDFMAILDNASIMNRGAGFSLAEISSDDYFLDFNHWDNLTVNTHKNAYIWEENLFEGDQSYDWNKCYSRILMTNIVLENVNKLRKDNDVAKEYLDELEAFALFHRSWNYHFLNILFASTYEGNEENLGVPLKISSRLDEKVSRPSLKQSYDQMVNDLLKAEKLLPNNKQTFNTRPSLLAVHGLLSRIYLYMGNYEKSLEYSQKAISYIKLLDYKTISKNNTFPFSKDNPEIIFYDVLSSLTILNRSRLQIDSVLYKKYSELDLRKELYFGKNGNILTFRGSYEGSAQLFVGLTSSEILLNHIESLARLGQTGEAKKHLNSFLNKRYSDLEEVTYSIENSNRIIDFILEERRKELIFRGVRWADLKRLNINPNTSTVLKRKLVNLEYILLPNDPKYVFLIPDNAIQLGGYEQNSRN